MDQHIKKLAADLGFADDAGFLAVEEFHQGVGAVHGLAAAASLANVQASFGVWEQGFSTSTECRYVPLVYLAKADTEVEVQSLHRWVWSQGIAPWLLVVHRTEVFVCPGFGYNAQQWPQLVKRLSLASSGTLDPSLADFSALKLKSSVRWRDFSLVASGAVDKKLLRALRDLHKRFTDDPQGATLKPALINRLIGRILYTFLLLDRNLIPENWVVTKTGGSQSEVGRQRLSIKKADFWALQEKIDDIFNGAVFQISASDRQRIRQSDLDLAIDFIRGGTVLSGGGEQSDLFDIDLTALQVETLSAVYEEFLRRESVDGMRRDGVVYTPSFLVDFVINRLDDDCSLNEKSRLLDPTAGSGVFLVAAYRRIIERTLADRKLTRLPLKDLQEILTSCIFGIEKSPSAAAVTAFSLYLNVLEYCEKDEILNIVRKKIRPRVFPPLVGLNILAKDFFSAKNHFQAHKFTAVVGNPPWKPLPLVSSHHGELDAYPIDKGEAAEQIVWESLHTYLEPGGLLAMVMPSKSFASPSAKTFASALGKQFHVRGLVNLSHWRRHLFENAEQPAALLFVSKQPVSDASRTLFYTPLLWGQPFVPQAMWTLTMDAADLHSLPSLTSFANAGSVFDAYSLKPIDRAVKQRLHRVARSERAATLGSVLDRFGLKINKGGSPRETLLSASVICDPTSFATDHRKPKAFLRLNSHDKKLSSAQIKQCHENYRAKFTGDRLLLARSMQYARSVDFPLAVNSSFNVIYWPEVPKHLDIFQQKNLLDRIAQFLFSDFARYQFALFGQLWQTDNARVEIRDLLKISAPSPDFFIKPESEAPATNIQILQAMGAMDVIEPLADYMNHRKQFENGKCPVANEPQTSIPQQYLSVLKSTLSSNLGDLVVDCKAGQISSTSNSAQVLVHVKYPLPKCPQEGVSSRSFQFYDSAIIEWELDSKVIFIAKPLGMLYFTAERAYSDALKMSNKLLIAA